MTKAELKILERLYGAEIEAALWGGSGIVQIKSKLMAKLEADGFVKHVMKVIPADRQCPFPIKISGWELTLLGNAAYCLTCGDDGDEERK